MSEQEYEVDPETGEAIPLEGDLEAEAEEAESEEAAIQSDSDEPGADSGTGSAAEPPEDSIHPDNVGLTEADIEKNSKAMNRAADTYIKKVLSVLGDDLGGMQTCPLCAESWPGVRYPVMPSPEHLAAARIAIGLEPGDNLPKDNYSRTCDACDGWGYTDSGSKVPGQTKLTCYDCNGKGWKAVGQEREGGAITAPNGAPSEPIGAFQDHPSNDPPEVERLKQLGYVVVAPIVPEGV